MSITITLDHIPAHVSTAGLLTRIDASDPHQVGQIANWFSLLRQKSDITEIAFDGDGKDFLAYLQNIEREGFGKEYEMDDLISHLATGQKLSGK